MTTEIHLKKVDLLSGQWGSLYRVLDTMKIKISVQIQTIVKDLFETNKQNREHLSKANRKSQTYY